MMGALFSSHLFVLMRRDFRIWLGSDGGEAS